MRDLLFLSHRIPYPPDKGDKIRAWHMFRHLAQRFRMHLGCFIDDPDDLKYETELRPLCAGLACIRIDPRIQRLKALLRARPGQPLTLGYFHDARLRSWVDATLDRHAIQHIFVYSSAVAHYAMRATAPVRVLDMVDVDSSKWTAYAATARWSARALFAREGRTLLAFERRAAREFSHSIFVNEAEWRHFAALAPEAHDRTGWVENGVETEHFSPELAFPDPFPPLSPLAPDRGAPAPGTPTPDVPSQPESSSEPGPSAAPGATRSDDVTHLTPRLVFTGRMDYRPNVDAVTWFARAVMPILRARIPAARFAIVGAAPSPEVCRLAELPGVIVTGRVVDTRPWLAHASIVVAPLLIGRGTQNKVLEGMAMARPVIATPEAFEGVQAQPERDILLACGVEQTIVKILDVLSGRYPGLGAAARRAVQVKHDWSSTLAKLDDLFPEDLVPAPHVIPPSDRPIPPAPEVAR